MIAASAQRGVGVGLLLAMIFASVPTTAQGIDCAALRAEIERASSGPSGSGQFAEAIRQQQFESQRAQAYADSIGCNAGFLFGGGTAECEGLAARIERMQNNIAQLQQQAEQSGGEGGERRRALVEQYNGYCSGGESGGYGDPAQSDRIMPVDPDSAPPEGTPGEAAAPQGESKVLCVRHCDGGFFPIAYKATPDKFEGLARLCKAQCPNAEVSLYTTATEGDIETAVSTDGAAYTALPAAFKYQKSYDPACSCRAPHQSWVEALAEAEKLIERDRGDVVVTQKLSDAMSRPAQPAAPVAAPLVPKPAKKTKTARKPKASPSDLGAPGAADQGGDIAPPSRTGEDITRQFRRDAPTL